MSATGRAPRSYRISTIWRSRGGSLLNIIQKFPSASRQTRCATFVFSATFVSRMQAQSSRGRSVHPGDDDRHVVGRAAREDQLDQPVRRDIGGGGGVLLQYFFAPDKR